MTRIPNAFLSRLGLVCLVDARCVVLLIMKSSSDQATVQILHASQDHRRLPVHDDYDRGEGVASTPAHARPPNPSWRQYGQARRRWLLEHDGAATSEFRMNAACSIQKYVALANRVRVYHCRRLLYCVVLSTKLTDVILFELFVPTLTTIKVMIQFNDLCERNATEDAYVMGHRLVSFMTTALPRHPEFSTTKLTTERRYLARIQTQMRLIALAIDEEQLNVYITNDYDPVFSDDDEEDTGEIYPNETPTHSSPAWENFAGWSFASSTSSSSTLEDPREGDVPGAVDTDESSQDIDEEHLSCLVIEKSVMEDNTSATIGVHDDIMDPELEDISDDYDEDEDELDRSLEYDENDDEYGSFCFDLKPPSFAPSILKQIAREQVQYETDSEANDSWAQSNDDGALSDATETSLTEVVSLSCDPARVAFREIMNRHSEQLQSLQLEMDRLRQEPYHPVAPPPPPPPPPRAPMKRPQKFHDFEKSLLDVGSVSFSECLHSADGLEPEIPSPPPPSPENLEGLRKQVLPMENQRDIQYIGFSTHSSLRRLP